MHPARRAALAALILSVCPLVHSQNSRPLAGDRPTYRTRTQEVVVDVVVGSDGNNAPPQLSAKNFSIFEDGKPQKIVFFEEHGAKTLPPGAAATLPAMPPNVYTNVPQVPESDAVSTLLLDSLNTGVQDQMYVRNEATAFLKAMAPGTEVAIFSLGWKLDLVQRFTTDPAKLLTALGAAAAEPSPAVPLAATAPKPEDGRKDPAGRQSKGLASTAPAWTYPGNANVILKSHTDIRARMTLEALDYLGRYLAAVPGRKNLIWISDEFPVTIFPSLSQRQGMENTPDIANHARRTADMLTRARVAIYPIQAEGMMDDKLAQAGNPLPGTARRPSPATGTGAESRIPMGNAVMSDFNEEAAQRADKVYSMEQLASDTGGKASYNSNDLSAAMTRAIRDGSHYYTLIYTPTNSKLDGSYRRIEVKLTNGKYKLSYRQGYNADSPADPVSPPDSDPLRPVMRLGLPQFAEILYGLRVLPAAKQPTPGAPHAGANAKLAGPVTRYSVDFMIRWTDLRLNPGPQNTHTGKIQVELLAYSPDGTALNWIGGTMAITLKPDIYAAIQRSGVPAHFDIDVPQGKQFVLSTGVYDWLSGKAGTLQVAQPPMEAAQNAPPPAASK
ncbi:MAG: VWA domain-containing protein [Terracidiphilus sp.]